MVSLNHQLPWNSHHTMETDLWVCRWCLWRSFRRGLLEKRAHSEFGRHISTGYGPVLSAGVWFCVCAGGGAKHWYSFLLSFPVFKNCYYVCVSVGTCILQHMCEQRRVWGSQFSPRLWAPTNEARPRTTGPLPAEAPQGPPDQGYNVNSCLPLVLPWLLYHDGLYCPKTS